MLLSAAGERMTSVSREIRGIFCFLFPCLIRMRAVLLRSAMRRSAASRPSALLIASHVCIDLTFTAVPGPAAAALPTPLHPLSPPTRLCTGLPTPHMTSGSRALLDPCPCESTRRTLA